ncbi:hypothetical protein CIPAW_08G109200 [Carya illinoinensis]|uniref:Zinc finger MYM-type protein 1-like n=1 Tax=Carya illinoinensis TaxID=32201 RepID=A0A8T1PV18_CARIL|nr:hypothetical protein CIPAW_08G109200 [Carya illinoinensis]
MDNSESNMHLESSTTTECDTSTTDERPSKTSRIQPEKMDATSLERNPRLWLQIWKFPSNLQDKIRRAYLKVDLNSLHKNAVKCCENLMNQSRHIDKLVEKQVSQEMENNQLRLKTLIQSVRLLTFRACAFRGNFIELIKLLANYNDQVNGVVIKNVPQNAKYTSPKIQNEILYIFVNKVQNVIREEIGDVKFCILVDETRDESKREQMTIILKFVDKDDTMALTLKNEICVLLSRYDIQIENIRAQRYDGGSNMCHERNGLQALFLKDSLVASSREAKHAHQFFVHLTSIINIIISSSKRYDELQSAQAAEIENIVNAMSLVSTTKVLIQNLRDDGWESLLTNVKSFCEKHQINIPDMNDQHTNFELQELNKRFNDHTMELNILSAALNPKGAYKLFKIDNICKLDEKFYPHDFTKQEKFFLRIQLLIRLILTLPISTATTEQAFSVMKLIKTILRIRMEDEFLADHLLVYNEKEIAKNFTSEMIMDEFYSMKDRRRA